MATMNLYDGIIEHAVEGNSDWDTDAFKAILMNATHAFAKADVAKATINANQIATANGYTQDTEALASVTVTQPTGGTTRFDCADISWTASGGSIGPTTDCVIYNDTSTVPGADNLICSIDFESSETAGDGTDLLITINASGILEVS